MGNKKKIPAALRNAVWNKYLGTENKIGLCFCCGFEKISFGNFDCGHIISRYDGGDIHIMNLRPICGLCNSSMSTQNMEIFMEMCGFIRNENWYGIGTNLIECDKIYKKLDNESKLINKNYFTKNSDKYKININKRIDDAYFANLFYQSNTDKYIFDLENEQWYSINNYGIYEVDYQNLMLKKHLKDFYNESSNIKKFIKCPSNNKNVMDELLLLYKRSNIYSEFDNINNFIMAFNNGVYDFITNEFRNAEPNELVTCTTGYNYEKPDKKEIQEIYNILIELLPNKDERTYLLKWLSFGLIGQNILEEFMILYGDGKEIILNLISYTLGNYFDNIEVEYFCKTAHQGHANCADPIMARKKNCRMVITTEPEGDINLRCAKLKQISGRDPVQVRDLYKAPFNFVPKFKLIIQTNEKLAIDGSDGGIIRRLRFIEFPTKFVDEPKFPNEKKIDRTIKPKMQEIIYRLAFFQILLEHYNDFIKNDNNRLDMPPRIKKDTENYLYENDPIKQFIEEKIEITKNIKDFVSSSLLYQAFIDYNEGNSKGITTMKFKNVLISKGFTFKKTKKGNGYVNINLKSNDNFLND